MPAGIRTSPAGNTRVGTSLQSVAGRANPIRQDHEELLAALTERLRVEGAPQGMWLVELAQARAHLQQLDDLLRRLADALLAGIPPVS